MSEMMIGTSAYASANPDLLKEAGMGWVRHGFGFPFKDRLGGELADAYVRRREQAEALVAGGLKLMGVTPGPGVATRKPDDQGRLVYRWQTRAPDWLGPLGSDEFLANYGEVCRWLADDLRGILKAWQICNELDIDVFAGPLNARQACELVLAGARGLKAADPSLVVGHNPAGADTAYFFFARLHTGTEGLIDYCGIDGYYGTWYDGGPERWAERIAELHALTGAPVLVNEWGFSSAGAGITDEERRTGLSVCDLKKWHSSWGPGHTPEGQAAFVERAFDAFCAQEDALLGIFFYRWEDQETCWQCGAPDCPAETAWGLVDLEGNPKPAFYAFAEGARRLSQ